jgi:phosphomannomutase/phosphoglucomutase
MSHVFRQYDIRGMAGRDLTEEFVEELGKSLGTFYHRRKVDTISVGYDCRLSSIPFKKRLIQGLQESGINVYDLGLGPTPMVYFSLFHLPVGGGVMITGSHNPPNENGFKICLGQTTIYGEEIQELREIMESRDYRSGNGQIFERSLTPDYLSYLKSVIKPGSKRVKVVIDAGNGTGNITAAPLYRELGWDVVELFSEPDGNFPNHHPDPTIPENLTDLAVKVSESGADLGISFDGDADRIGVIDSQGRVLWGDQLMILFAREIVKSNPGAKIIGEVKCSQTMFDQIRGMNGSPIMWKVGHSLIKAKMKEEGALLAGEMSGHLFFADRYYGYDDAVYSGARLLEILSHSNESLSQMVDALPTTCSTPEIRVDCPEDQKFAVVTQLVKRFQSLYEVIDIDGARIIFKNGWGLVRASNTQPVLVTRYEASSTEELSKIRQEVEGVLHQLLA